MLCRKCHTEIECCSEENHILLCPICLDLVYANICASAESEFLASVMLGNTKIAEIIRDKETETYMLNSESWGEPIVLRGGRDAALHDAAWNVKNLLRM